MRIPPDAVIADEKLSRYLLVPKARNDKSKFLARAGFERSNPNALREAIQSLAATIEATLDQTNEYGEFYRVEGDLSGVNGVRLHVVAIWIRRRVDGRFHFVTLVPIGDLR